MLIDCTHCQARVDAEILEVAAYYDGEVWPDSYQLALLRCPVCRHLVVGEQTLLKEAETDFSGNVIEEEEWGVASRVWPEPVSQLAMSTPDTIRTCLLEARKCLHATAYTACSP